MSACHEHNLREPLPGTLSYGICVRLRKGDPFRNLLGEDWEKRHWFATRAERDRALEQMSSRYVYFRPGDQPALEFESLDPAA